MLHIRSHAGGSRPLRLALLAVQLLACGMLVARPVSATPSGKIVGDPIFTGFDGVTFDFHEVGDFTILEDASGWKLDGTFAPAVPQKGDETTCHFTFTSALRVVSPQGDMLTCALPAIRPNTTKMAVISKKSDPSVIGCTVTTPKWIVNIQQVSGYEQVLKGHGKFVGNYTWLEMSITLLAPLASPVAGIMGNTYPAALAVGAQEGALHPDTDTTQAIGSNAAVTGSEAEADSDSHRRLMAGSGWPAGMTLSATIGY